MDKCLLPSDFAFDRLQLWRRARCPAVPKSPVSRCAARAPGAAVPGNLCGVGTGVSTQTALVELYGLASAERIETVNTMVPCRSSICLPVCPVKGQGSSGPLAPWGSIEHRTPSPVTAAAGMVRQEVDPREIEGPCSAILQARPDCHASSAGGQIRVFSGAPLVEASPWPMGLPAPGRREGSSRGKANAESRCP